MAFRLKVFVWSIRRIQRCALFHEDRTAGSVITEILAGKSGLRWLFKIIVLPLEFCLGNVLNRYFR